MTSPEQLGRLQSHSSDAAGVQQLMQDDPALTRVLHERLFNRAAEVIWAVRNEMARTVDDVLARRTRALMLDVRAAIEMAPEVAKLIAAERKLDAARAQRQIL